MVPADGQETAFPGLMAGPARCRGDSVVRSLHAFGAGRGVPASAACLLDYDVIEAFCVAGLPGRAASTRGTYRSVLYALAGQIHGPPSRRATPFCGAQAPPPYSRDERAELIWIAMAQRSPVKRSSELARGAGDGFVFRPGPAARDYKNFVTGFAGRLVTDPAAPRLSMGRCRATFICDHLAAGTPPGELLAVTGICEAGSLARYARHVEGAPSRAVLRAWDKS